MKKSHVLNINKIRKNVSGKLEISVENLTDEFANQASEYAYFAFLEEEAKADRDELKLRIEIYEASLAKKIRSKHNTDDGKLTDKTVEFAIHRNKKWKLLSKELIAAQYKTRVLTASLKASDQRCQMLISLGAHLRKEQDGTSIITLKKKAKKRMGRDRG